MDLQDHMTRVNRNPSFFRAGKARRHPPRPLHLGLSLDLYPPRFMLMVTSIPEDKRDQLQAVCHQGGTGRLQAIRREWNPGYYDVVAKFGEATGIPVVLNTSYNLRGEPIVNTPQNALHTFRESGLDALAMGPYLIQK